MGEKIRVGLNIHPIKYINKWVNITRRQVDSISEGVHVELATGPMEEETRLNIEVMKGDSVSKIYGEQIRLTATMAIEQCYRTKK